MGGMTSSGPISGPTDGPGAGMRLGSPAYTEEMAQQGQYNIDRGPADIYGGMTPGNGLGGGLTQIDPATGYPYGITAMPGGAVNQTWSNRTIPGMPAHGTAMLQPQQPSVGPLGTPQQSLPTLRPDQVSQLAQPAQRGAPQQTLVDQYGTGPSFGLNNGGFQFPTAPPPSAGNPQPIGNNGSPFVGNLPSNTLPTSGMGPQQIQQQLANPNGGTPKPASQMNYAQLLATLGPQGMLNRIPGQSPGPIAPPAQAQQAPGRQAIQPRQTLRQTAPVRPQVQQRQPTQSPLDRFIAADRQYHSAAYNAKRRF